MRLGWALSHLGPEPFLQLRSPAVKGIAYAHAAIIPAVTGSGAENTLEYLGGHELMDSKAFAGQVAAHAIELPHLPSRAVDTMALVAKAG